MVVDVISYGPMNASGTGCKRPHPAASLRGSQSAQHSCPSRVSAQALAAIPSCRGFWMGLLPQAAVLARHVSR